MVREMPTLEVLIKARALIARQENWCKGNFAVDAKGNDKPVRSKLACKWCAHGALLKESRSTEKQSTRYTLAVQVLEAHTRTCLLSFNDDPTTTHADILALFDRAIAAEQLRK